MIIPINDRYRIHSDRYQWIIAKSRFRKGKKEWQPDSFHRSFDHALRSLEELMVRESKAETLAEALTHVDHVATTLSQALTLEYSSTRDSRSASIAAFSLCAARQASSDPVASAASAQRRAAHPYDAFAHCFVQELCIAESRELRVRAASCIAHRHLPLAVSAHS